MALTQPLSSYNVFHQIQQDICDIVNGSPVLSGTGIEFIAENALDVDYLIKEALQKQGMAALVMTPDAEYLGLNGNSEAYLLNNLTILFVEYTPINRAKNKASVITGLDLANYTSELLGGPNAVIGFGKLCPKGIEQGEDGGLLVTKLTFQTYIENGGVGPIIYIPFVTREEMEAYVGDGRLTFKKNGLEIGSFSANTSSDVEIEIPNGGVWGSIDGNIEDQTDLMEKFDNVDDRLGEIEGDVSTVKSNLISTQNELADAKRDISETNSRVDSLSADYNTTKADVAGIKSKIPNAASTENQLADKAFVNSSINNYAAFYLTKNANGDAFGTYTDLSSATKFYNAGEERTPTKNDYCVVLEDETKPTPLGVFPTTRYTYQGTYPDGQWEFQYIVNNTSLTLAQIDAINSGITQEIVDSRVIPSTSNAGWAENAEFAHNAYYAVTADNAGIADYANYAGQADTSMTADIALTSYTSDYANNAANAENALFAADAAHSQYSDGAAMAEEAARAENATNADSARYAENAQYADIAYQAYTADEARYAPDYTPLSTYNALLSGYASTLLSGVTTDDQTVSFYILTKNA